MTETFKIFQTTPGMAGIGSHQLAYKIILKVVRSGIGYDVVNGIIGTPGNRQVGYIGFLGILNFSWTEPFNPGETVYVLYKDT